MKKYLLNLQNRGEGFNSYCESFSYCLNNGDYFYKNKNSSLEGGGERSETVGVRSNTPPDLRSYSPSRGEFLLVLMLRLGNIKKEYAAKFLKN